MSLRPKIWFHDHEIEMLVKSTGLSKLELIGLIAEMNRFTSSHEAIKQWEHDEMMGRHIG